MPELHTFYLVKTLPLVCVACEARWLDWMPTACRADFFIEHLQTRRCPSCGSDWNNLYPQDTRFTDLTVEPKEP
jgi:hypothetical protein